jgi:limonene-1,2-epoxide hydrolase
VKLEDLDERFEDHAHRRFRRGVGAAFETFVLGPRNDGRDDRHRRRESVLSFGDDIEHVERRRTFTARTPEERIMTENQAVVRAFIDAFNANDLAKIMDFFHADAVYHNIPVEPVRGTDAIRAVIQGFLGLASEVDWVVHNLAESESGAVLTERTDRFLIRDTWVELPVMGAFVVRAGKLSEWRDYFDMQQFQSQLPT